MMTNVLLPTSSGGYSTPKRRKIMTPVSALLLLIICFEVFSALRSRAE